MDIIRESIHELENNETDTYSLETLMSEGRAQEKGVSEEDVDPNELAMGIKVEMEHTSNEDVAKKIALDHLSELSDYYTRLKQMESASE